MKGKFIGMNSSFRLEIYGLSEKQKSEFRSLNIWSFIFPIFRHFLVILSYFIDSVTRAVGGD
jgi:hypothetical protein